MTGGELSCEAVVEEVAFMMLGCEGEEAFPESLQRGSRVAGWLAHQVLLSVFYKTQIHSISAGRGGPVARGRNIFPKEERRGRGGRVNNLFKRFQAQHRDKLGEPEGDLLYDGFDTVKSRRERISRTRTRSRSRGRGDRRSRKRSASSSSDSSRSSSSSEDSDSHKKKKKKIKKEKKEKKDKKKKKEKKKKDSGKKKKKDKDSSSDSEEEKNEESNSDWRVELLKKMKDIKNLPPEELEAEFKKAMDEKKKKEQEEQCLNAIKERQKMARKVKKQAEKEAKRQEKLKAKEVKEEETEDGFYGSGDGGFYNGFDDALGRMQSLQENNQLPEEAKENPFMSSFNEVPFVPEDANPEEDEMGNHGHQEGGEGEELDPYARAQADAMMRMKEERGEEVSWPAGAIENNMGMGEGEGEMTKEEMDAQQEAMEMEANNLDDKTKDVVNTSKMFSKIRNRIKGKPLKINLKPKKSTEEGEEDPGLEPVDTPLEGLSGEEAEQFGDYEEFEEKVGLDDEYDLRQEPHQGSRSRGVSKSGDEEEERRVARYRERARRRRERSAVEPGELEDGEHSPSPEPERPHHRRRRRRRHERREESEDVVLEDGEVVEGSRRERRRRRDRTPEDYQGPKDHGPPGVFPPSLLGPPPGYSAPPPIAVDTSVPPPSLPIANASNLPAIGPGYGYGHGANHAPPMQATARPPFHPQQPYQAQAYQGPQATNPQPLGPHSGYGPRTSPEYGARTSPDYAPRTSPDYGSRSSPAYRGPSQPASPNYQQQGSYHQAQQHQQTSPHYNNHSGPPSPRWDAYSSGGGRRAPPIDVRRHPPPMSQQPEIKKESNNLFFDSLPTEAVDSAEEEESEVDITKVSPIMKYMATKLVDQKYHLEMAGPFAYRSDIPGLSKHLFVAYKMVTMLEEAGYTGSKMYMSAMFPAGLKDTKTELIGLVSKGKLHPGIKGSKLTKLCIRCIRCFLAYYTGKSDDIDTSDGECSDSNEEEEGEDEGGNKPNKTVTTSMMDVLQRVKEEKNQPEDEGNEVAAASVAGGRFSTEDNPWQTMELGMRSEKLRSFTALQSHFTKQLVGKGVDQRDAREQASDSMMCLVVADFNDASLRYMVDKWKKVILPEQSQLEVSRPRHEQTLYDQLVAKILKHRSEFPLAIIQEVQAEADPNAALTHKVRNIVERVLRFYMRGLGKLQEGKGEATTGLAAPADPSGLQFNYLPEGLREEEGSQGGGGGAPANQPINPGNPTNFFNMDAAATANRQFSSYKRLSLDDPALEPVSPEHSTSFSNPSSMGGKTQLLARQKYLFGTFYVDTLLYNGSNYVYEIGVHMSDSSSCEVSFNFCTVI